MSWQALLRCGLFALCFGFVCFVACTRLRVAPVAFCSLPSAVVSYAGEFSPSFAQLEGLTQLLAGGNYFRAVRALPPSLLQLDLSANAIEGELAHWLPSLIGLVYVDLSYNSFTGTIDALQPHQLTV